MFSHALSIGRSGVLLEAPSSAPLSAGCALVPTAGSGSNWQLGFTSRPVLVEPAVAPVNNSQYYAADRTWKSIPEVTSGSIQSALGYVPANDSQVVKLTGDQTVGGTKNFSGYLQVGYAGFNQGNTDIYKFGNNAQFAQYNSASQLHNLLRTDAANLLGATTFSGPVNLSSRDITSTGTGGVRIIGDPVTGTFPLTILSGPSTILQVGFTGSLSLATDAVVNVGAGLAHFSKIGASAGISGWNDIILRPGALQSGTTQAVRVQYGNGADAPITASSYGFSGNQATIAFGSSNRIFFNMLNDPQMIFADSGLQLRGNRTVSWSDPGFTINPDTHVGRVSAGAVGVYQADGITLGSLRATHIAGASGVGIDPSNQGLVGTIGFTNTSINLTPATIIRWQNSYGAPYTDSNSHVGLKQNGTNTLAVVRGDGTTLGNLQAKKVSVSGVGEPILTANRTGASTEGNLFRVVADSLYENVGFVTLLGGLSFERFGNSLWLSSVESSGYRQAIFTPTQLILPSNGEIGFASTEYQNAGANVRFVRGSVGPTIDALAAGGLRVRNVANNADAPIAAGAANFSGTIQGGNTLILGGTAYYESGRIWKYGGYQIHSAGVGTPAPTDFGNQYINFNSWTGSEYVLDIAADSSRWINLRAGGVRVRNSAGNADGPITAGAATFSGNLTVGNTLFVNNAQQRVGIGVASGSALTIGGDRILTFSGGSGFLDNVGQITSSGALMLASSNVRFGGDVSGGRLNVIGTADTAIPFAIQQGSGGATQLVTIRDSSGVERIAMHSTGAATFSGNIALSSAVAGQKISFTYGGHVTEIRKDAYYTDYYDSSGNHHFSSAGGLGRGTITASQINQGFNTHVASARFRMLASGQRVAEVYDSGLAVWQSGDREEASSSGLKRGFFNATPILQVTTGITGATHVAGVGTGVKVDDTFGGYTIGQAIAALRAYGLLA